MSIYQTHFGVTIIFKCSVTTKINLVDMLYAATVVNLNILDHLSCLIKQPNVLTAQVIILQTQNNAHKGRKRRKYSKSNVKNNFHFLMLINNMSNSSQVKLMQVLSNRHLQQKATEKTQVGTQGKSNSSHPGPALKQATLDMMKKDEEKKKKEEKDKLKKQQKEEKAITIFQRSSTSRKRTSTKNKTS